MIERIVRGKLILEYEEVDAVLDILDAAGFSTDIDIDEE